MDPLTVFLAVNGIYGQVQVVRKRPRGFAQLVVGQVVWLVWEGIHFSLAGPLMIGTVCYLVTYLWGWRSWRSQPGAGGTVTKSAHDSAV